MSRTYTLKRRAHQQAATRLRIVEAAISLHGSVGPARTTMSMVAEQAGVQRHTLYAHFPTEWDLALACSGLSLERDPLPDAQDWRAISEPSERLRVALGSVYGWYERNAELAACVLRDAESDVLTKQVCDLRFGSTMAAWHEVLGADRGEVQRALVHLALNFFTWRALARESGLSQMAAVDAMVNAIACDRNHG